MRGLISVFIAFFVAAVLTLPMTAESRLCPSKNVWILVQMTDSKGKPIGVEPMFLPKGELGQTSGACPETTTDILIPVYDNRGKLVGQINVTLIKGYLDNPGNVYDKMPSNPNMPKKKKPAPRPKKKRRIPPADNIRTWHADMPASVD